MKPKLLKLEITTVCNARCVFCSHPTLKREKRHMATAHALRLILEAAQWGLEEVQPQWFGEPTLHPDFAEICAVGLDQGLRVVYYTNGSRPMPKASMVIVSVESHTQELMDQLRPGVKLERVVENVERYKADYPCAGIMFRGCEVPENRSQLPEIQRFWSKWGRFVSVPEFPRGRPTDSEPKPMWEMSDCPYPSQQAIVRVDGLMVPCCTDYEGKVLGGNAIEEGLQAAWHHPMLVAFRNAVAHRAWPTLCESCGYRWR